jgi:hypothetical protein
VSEARELLLQMERAEQRGDRHSARELARTILASGEHPIARPSDEARTADGASPVSARAPEGALRHAAQDDEALSQLSARELLARTEPDAFLLVVGILGLGLLVWLVYNYVL